MKIFVINPNASQAMTRGIVASAQLVVSAGAQLISGTGNGGAPLSIEGAADEVCSVPPMLVQIRQAEAEGAQATVIACFDDPGLDAAREVAAGPVLGICQTAVQAAMVVAKRFSIVTTLPRSVPLIEDLVQRYGAGHHCRRVRAINLPVLSLESDSQKAFDLLAAETLRAQEEDGAEAVILGCAGMAEMAERLQQATGMPVIDGVTVAVRMAEALIGCGLKTSKANAYAFPREK